MDAWWPHQLARAPTDRDPSDQLLAPGVETALRPRARLLAPGWPHATARLLPATRKPRRKDYPRGRLCLQTLLGSRVAV